MQAPQLLVSQPITVPVLPSFSRRYCTSSIRGSTSSATCSPSTVRLIRVMGSPLCSRVRTTCGAAHARPHGWCQVGSGRLRRASAPSRARSAIATASRPLSSGTAGCGRPADAGRGRPGRPRAPRCRTAPARCSAARRPAAGRPAAPRGPRPRRTRRARQGRGVGAGQQVAAVGVDGGADLAAAEQREHVLDVGGDRHQQPVGAGASWPPRAARRCDTSALSVENVIAWSP